MPQRAQGVTSASLIVIILTAAAIGAIVGGIIGTNLEHGAAGHRLRLHRHHRRR